MWGLVIETMDMHHSYPMHFRLSYPTHGLTAGRRKLVRFYRQHNAHCRGTQEQGREAVSL